MLLRAKKRSLQQKTAIGSLLHLIGYKPFFMLVDIIQCFPQILEVLLLKMVGVPPGMPMLNETALVFIVGYDRPVMSCPVAVYLNIVMIHQKELIGLLLQIFQISDAVSE